MKWTEDKINEIIDLKVNNGERINIFKLHGVLFVGNTENHQWDLSKRYAMFSEHSLVIRLEDFEFCKTEDDVHEEFSKAFREAVMEKLI